MNLGAIVQSWKVFISKMNDKGVPIPMVRYKGEGSPGLTLVVVSSLLVVIGIMGKWSGMAGGVNEADAMQFFYASCTLFFGHSWVHKNDSGTDTLDGGSGDQK